MAKKIQYLSTDGGYTALKLQNFDRIAAISGQGMDEQTLSNMDMLCSSNNQVWHETDVVMNLADSITRMPADQSLTALNGAAFVMARDPVVGKWIAAKPYAELKPTRAIRVCVEFPAKLIDMMQKSGWIIGSPKSFEELVVGSVMTDIEIHLSADLEDAGVEIEAWSSVVKKSTSTTQTDESVTDRPDGNDRAIQPDEPESAPDNHQSVTMTDVPNSVPPDLRDDQPKPKRQKNQKTAE